MLRKITTLAIATFTFSAAFAQQESSAKMISPMRRGTLSFGLNVDLPQIVIDNDRKLNYNLRLNPNAGYFLTNNLMLIVQVHGGVYQSRTNYRSQTRGQIVGGGFDLRLYFGKPESRALEIRRFRMFAQAGASLNHYWHQSHMDGRFQYRNSSPELELRAGAGGSYLVTNRFAIEASLIYRQWAVDYTPGNGEGALDGQLGLRMFLSSGKK